MAGKNTRTEQKQAAPETPAENKNKPANKKGKGTFYTVMKIVGFTLLGLAALIFFIFIACVAAFKNVSFN